MNVKIDGAQAYVTLSRRNLLTLLAKLDKIDCPICRGFEHPPESERMIHRYNEEGDHLIVVAEEDDVHYGKRGYGPGPMHPDTERAVRCARRAGCWRSAEHIAEYNVAKLRKRYPDGFTQERSINRAENEGGTEAS